MEEDGSLEPLNGGIEATGPKISSVYTKGSFFDGLSGESSRISRNEERSRNYDTFGEAGGNDQYNQGGPVGGGFGGRGRGGFSRGGPRGGYQQGQGQGYQGQGYQSQGQGQGYQGQRYGGQNGQNGQNGGFRQNGYGRRGRGQYRSNYGQRQEFNEQ